ncbi:zinc finger, CCHC-type containing protein [Tanacetum coccineum]|uniref:Zinc finger, CCHC-type containing protein n=1 Tax=Tanacetum coccineum TaxID=301880 RepID=A0ABQ5GPT3_9ASTR
MEASFIDENNGVAHWVNLLSNVSTRPISAAAKNVERATEREDMKNFSERKKETLGWLLEKIHVTWAHFEKKRTRLQLYTKSLEEIIIQTVETASPALATASELDQDGVKSTTTASESSNWLERLPTGSISTWEDLTTRFLAQFFPLGRTAKLSNDILMFQQHQGESLSEA